MDIVALLASFIYLVSSSLLLPMLLLLSLCTLWLVVYSGRFFALWLARRRLPPQNDPAATLLARRLEHFPGPVRTFATAFADTRGGPGGEAAAINLLRASEHRLWRSLDRLRLIIRIGPGLGLIGTLIPMGTGLAALSQGDLTRLSGDLVIAFTTTVVGMALGLLSYFFFTVQKRWVEEDVRHMELFAELFSGEGRP